MDKTFLLLNVPLTSSNGLLFQVCSEIRMALPYIFLYGHNLHGSLKKSVSLSCYFISLNL